MRALSSINRTILELKLAGGDYALSIFSPINRTILELKLDDTLFFVEVFDYQSHHFGIETWHVNVFKRTDRAINRTILELKPK